MSKKRVKYSKFIKESFKHLVKNPILFLPDILYVLITAILLALFFKLNNLFPILQAETIVEDYLRNILQSAPQKAQLIISLIIGVALNVAAGIMLVSTKYSLITGILNKKKTSLLNSYKLGKKFWWKIFAIKLIMIALFSAPIIVLGLLTIAVPQLAILWGILLISTLILINLAFLFRYPLLFFEKNNYYKTLRKTYKFFKINKQHTLLTLIIILIVSVLISSVLSLVQDLSPNIVYITIYTLVSAIINLGVGIWADIFLFRNFKI